MNDRELKPALDQAVERLPRDIAPPRDLWPGIEQALEMRAAERAKKPRHLPAAAAAAVVAAGLWLGYANFERSGAVDPGERIDMSALIADMDQGYELQKAALLENFGKGTALTNNWRDQLAELESARQAIKASLAEDPNNLYLVHILQNIYMQQIDLIERVHQQTEHSI